MYARAKGKYLEWTTEEGLSQLEGWARDGLTDEQIAKNIGIRRSALYSWKKDHLDIMDALKKGKEVVDYQVENALLKKALGMTVVEQQFKVVHVDGDILSVERKKFAIAWELEYPDATQKEMNDAPIQNVPEYKKIPFGEYHKELAPDTNAAMFWLKNRRPDKYREQSFRELNDAQAQKAMADVRKANAEADIAEAKARDIKNVADDGESVLIVNDLGERNDE